MAHAANLSDEVDASSPPINPPRVRLRVMLRVFADIPLMSLAALLDL